MKSEGVPDRKKVLLIISGGIAAYKSLDLIRRLKERGLSVRCILTKGGAAFITPLCVAALSEEPCYQNLFDLKEESEMGHIRLSRETDLILVAPATADILAKMAHGHADDLATSCLLASSAPIAVAPSMNVLMWENPATKANIARLHTHGMHILEPEGGILACGEEGRGRMQAPEALASWVQDFLTQSRGLAGRKALVTAGPTHEAIDPVRYIANRSSGKQGYAVAKALAQQGAEVTLISGPVGLPAPLGVKRLCVQSAEEMLTATMDSLPADIAVCTAAVADWRIVSASHKLKKNEAGPPILKLSENPDILYSLCQNAKRPKLVIGFAAETEKLREAAQRKRQRKGCDWIFANLVTADTFGGDQNSGLLIHADGEEVFAAQSKMALALNLSQRIVQYFNNQ